MNVEQRLVDALQSVNRVEPSPDLFSRVVHSIDEDRLHRRRIVRTTAALVLAVGGLALAMSLSLVEGTTGRHVQWQEMELIETLLLVIVVLVLGPAIRRFGRNYVGDLWTTDPTTPSALLRLLDLAYALVFCGYILLTARFAEPALSQYPLGTQIGEMATRLAGLLLIMGMLHALTIVVLPLIALVSNSTRTGRRLPRWVTVLLVVLGVPGGLWLIQLLIGLFAVGLS
jgi:hypothetical protein